MSNNPILDNSPWTIAALCMCQGCRNRRNADFRGLLRTCLYDGNLTMTYSRPAFHRSAPNLPARRKWLARRARMIINGKTILFCGWDLTAPSGRRRWYPTRESMMQDARKFRFDEMITGALETMREIGMQLIS